MRCPECNNLVLPGDARCSKCKAPLGGPTSTLDAYRRQGGAPATTVRAGSSGRCPACNARVLPGDTRCSAPGCGASLVGGPSILDAYGRQEARARIDKALESLQAHSVPSTPRAGLGGAIAARGVETDVEVKLETPGVVNYLLYNAGVPVAPMIRIRNRGGSAVDDAEVRISLRPGAFVEIPPKRMDLPGGKTVEIRDLPLALDAEPFQSLTEAVSGAWDVEIRADETAIAGASVEVTIHPLREWVAVRGFADSIAGLITPNDPAVRQFVAAIPTSFSGYQSGRKEEVLRQVVALFDAVKAGGFHYIGVPPSFEGTGQKVRFPYEVIRDRRGTCLDWCVFVSALLEYVGLCSLIVLVPGHAFHAVWMEEVTGVVSGLGPNEFKDMVRDGMILPFNSTNYFAPDDDFEKARKVGTAYVAKTEDLIDITSCRARGVKPVALKSPFQAGPKGA